MVLKGDPMDNTRLEYWVIDVLDRVVAGDPVEDSRVELKRIWPDPDRAARRIAGHANASHGEHVLWVIGADEKEGIVGAPNMDSATWFDQIKSRFVGVTPTLHDLAIRHSEETVVALCFDTSRAPYVNKESCLW